MEPDKPPLSKRSYISSIEVDGLWGVRDISVQFRPDINILVGKNGSGKTTILNMIADILLLDFDALSRMSFAAIRIRFTDPYEKKSPHLSIERVTSGAIKIDQGFNIRAFSDTKVKTPLAEQKISYQYRSVSLLSGFLSPSPQTLEPLKPALATFINNLASVTWISVHRKAPAQTSLRPTNYDSAVDERLEQINVRFTEFINEIDNESAVETADFQKQLLKSLMLTLPSVDLNASSFRKIDVKTLRERVGEILETLELETEEEKLDEIFEDVEKSINKIKKKTPVALPDLLNASYVLQMNKIVGNWTDYNARRRHILQRRYAVAYQLDKFITDKEAFINNAGRLFFFRKGDFAHEIYPQQLSSGEKQLYILLMETLLAARTPSIFMADEPELSLHVLWQEKLIEAMRALNDKAQLIFATHSPDLVGAYSKNVYDMDESGLLDVDEQD